MSKFFKQAVPFVVLIAISIGLCVASNNFTIDARDTFTCPTTGGCVNPTTTNNQAPDATTLDATTSDHSTQ